MSIEFHHAENGPCYFTHQALEHTGISHGFFTRRGGVSSGVYESLNCGLGSGDDISNALLNRAFVSAALGFQPEAISGLYQVHSAHCVVIDSPDSPYIASRHEADGMVTNQKGIALGILSADCAPVLMSCAASGIVGACHAGWRGALAGIIQNTVDAMCNLGASRNDIALVIGPSIQQKSYQVADALTDPLRAAFPDAEQFLIADNHHPNKYLFDLPGFAIFCANKAGITNAHVIDKDTYSDRHNFFSYRRSTHLSEKDSGRLISVIGYR